MDGEIPPIRSECSPKRQPSAKRALVISSEQSTNPKARDVITPPSNHGGAKCATKLLEGGAVKVGRENARNPHGTVRSAAVTGTWRLKKSAKVAAGFCGAFVSLELPQGVRKV